MNRHLSIRSGNPALQSETFRSRSSSDSERMTLEGAINKTSLSILVLMCTAFYTWTNYSPPVMIFGAIGGIVVALIFFWFLI